MCTLSASCVPPRVPSRVCVGWTRPWQAAASPHAYLMMLSPSACHPPACRQDTRQLGRENVIDCGLYSVTSSSAGPGQYTIVVSVSITARHHIIYNRSQRSASITSPFFIQRTKVQQFNSVWLWLFNTFTGPWLSKVQPVAMRACMHCASLDGHLWPTCANYAP